MANEYINSRVPHNLPRLKLYPPSYPLLCLAAQYSQRAYSKPTRNERETHVEASWRLGTKAMVIQSVPIDERNLVIFAIRGTQTFMDWAINLNSAPVSPEGFFDDAGNLCHSGFLSVARKMVGPAYARLRSLLEDDPSRSSYSLIITGHSAGGAIATLLYAHMLADGVGSELGILAGCFKRIHCITFGTPPLSLLPIDKPTTSRHKKSLFLSFINEGDPVPRADKAYVRSLLNLYTSPGPSSGAKCIRSLWPSTIFQSSSSSSLPKLALKSSAMMKSPAVVLTKQSSSSFKPKSQIQERAKKSPPSLKGADLSAPKKKTPPSPPQPPLPQIWPLPIGTLSNAGRLVILRSIGGDEDDIDAKIITDSQLRDIVFADPVMHTMNIYARRIEVLATKAAIII